MALSLLSIHSSPPLAPPPPPHSLRLLCSPSSEAASSEQLSHNLLHLLTDLIHYFHLPSPPSHTPNSHSTSSPSLTHDSWQSELCLLRERQELFQKQGMLLLTLNVIIETGRRCRTNSSLTTNQIHHKLYELLAAMIRGSRKNCSEFATEKWLKVFIDQLSMPQYTHDVLEVIQCLLRDSPEVLNIITKEHIQVYILVECSAFWESRSDPTIYMQLVYIHAQQ